MKRFRVFVTGFEMKPLGAGCTAKRSRGYRLGPLSSITYQFRTTVIDALHGPGVAMRNRWPRFSAAFSPLRAALDRTPALDPATYARFDGLPRAVLNTSVQ